MILPETNLKGLDNLILTMTTDIKTFEQSLEKKELTPAFYQVKEQKETIKEIEEMINSVEKIKKHELNKNFEIYFKIKNQVINLKITKKNKEASKNKIKKIKEKLEEVTEKFYQEIEKITKKMTISNLPQEKNTQKEIGNTTFNEGAYLIRIADNKYRIMLCKQATEAKIRGIENTVITPNTRFKITSFYLEPTENKKQIRYFKLIKKTMGMKEAIQKYLEPKKLMNRIIIDDVGNENIEKTIAPILAMSYLTLFNEYKGEKPIIETE